MINEIEILLIFIQFLIILTTTFPTTKHPLKVSLVINIIRTLETHLRSLKFPTHLVSYKKLILFLNIIPNSTNCI